MAEAAIDLDFDAILADAQSRAGVGEFSQQFYLEPLRRLLRSFEDEANLNAMGRALQRERIVGQHATNLGFEDHWRRFPEIADERIDDPIVIVGFGRTGTTLLQRLLAADPRLYGLLWWEGRFPVPFPGESIERPDERIRTACEEVAMMYETVPGLEALHPLDAMQADEEILLLEQSFCSGTPESFAQVREFGHWLEQQDQRPAYEYLRQLLQFVQWQKRRRGIQAERWVLKSPQHIQSADVLLEVFPDARIVHTHRDPLEVIPSWASLCYSLWQQNSDVADPVVCGRHWSEKFARGILKTLRVRDAGNEDRFLDVDYRDTARDPLAVVARVCDFVGWPHTKEAREAQERWIAANRRDLRPPHDYTLEMFGYTEDGLKASFREYRERFIR
jgi:hypothetical protein